MTYKTVTLIKESTVEQLQDWLLPESEEPSNFQSWRGTSSDWLNHHRYKWFKYLKQRRVVIQAGGCLGLYPRVLAQHFHSVYTFEPYSVSFYCLVNNCQIDNVYKMQMALGEKVDQVAIEFPASHLGMARLTNFEGNILVMPLDAFAFKNVDLIALDCEGSEANIIRGARKTIKKWKPVIITEMDTRGNSEAEQVNREKQAVIMELGYQAAEMSACDMIWLPLEKEQKKETQSSDDKDQELRQ